MPGRVKHPHPPPRQTVPPSQRKLYARRPQAPPPATPSATSGSLLSNATVDLKSQIINKHTLTWLIIVVVIAVATLVLVSVLLCRCRRRKRNKEGKKRLNRMGHSYHSSMQMADGRNQLWAWNKNIPKPGQGDGLGLQGLPNVNSAYSMTPLAKAAIKPAGYGEAYPGVRVVDADDDNISPLTTPTAYVRRPKEGGSRYYSGLSNAWKRISQIGRAY